MRLNIKLLVVLCLFPIFEQTPYQNAHLNTYDIWNDGAKIGKKDARTERSKRINTIEQIEPYEFNSTSNRKGKILSVFNIFSFTDETECKAQDGRRSGLCLNPYTCRRQGGTSSGFCAHGFGVCCVFTATCGSEIKNNLTYFISPEFPSLARSLSGCSVMIRKMDGASQLRLDFIHFNLGQPNRLTGDCDSDVFIMTGGSTRDFRLCGQNSDQHVYYDIDKAVNKVLINMKMSRPNVNRFWEIKVTQVAFGQRAPAGCMQYFTKKRGFIQTLNYADNGRHLANQDYKACVRQNRGMCSIAYEPCDARSFRIGPNAALQGQNVAGGGAGGNGGFIGGPGSFGGAGTEFVDPGPLGDPNSPTQGELAADDELVGSGDGAIPVVNTNQVPNARQFTRWSPYAQHLGGGGQDEQLWRYWGYGNYGQGVSSFGKQRCQDRIVTPCDGDEFIGAGTYSPGICDPFHCGSTLCPDLPSGQSCRIESSVKPFAVGIKFGPPTAKSNPEDNIGMCLRYEQVPCS